jgi:hypothetical protein
MVTVGQHAACCLGFNTEHPQLLVTGGRSDGDTPIEGTWCFDVAKKRWNEVISSSDLYILSSLSTQFKHLCIPLHINFA